MTVNPSPSGSEFDNFRDLTRRLLAVWKSEVPKHVPKKRVPFFMSGKRLRELVNA